MHLLPPLRGKPIAKCLPQLRRRVLRAPYSPDAALERRELSRKIPGGKNAAPPSGGSGPACAICSGYSFHSARKALIEFFIALICNVNWALDNLPPIFYKPAFCFVICP